MTTEVSIKVIHGHPVDVTLLNSNGGYDIMVRIMPEEIKSFHIWQGQDLKIHEVLE